MFVRQKIYTIKNLYFYLLVAVLGFGCGRIDVKNDSSCFRCSFSFFSNNQQDKKTLQDLYKSTIKLSDFWSLLKQKIGNLGNNNIILFVRNKSMRAISFERLANDRKKSLNNLSTEVLNIMIEETYDTEDFKKQNILRCSIEQEIYYIDNFIKNHIFGDSSPEKIISSFYQTFESVYLEIFEKYMRI